MRSNSPWICCQIGAREHYAIPRALHQRNLLNLLITDTWVKPRSALSRIPIGRLKQRYHPDLKNADIIDWSLVTIAKSALEWRSMDIWEQSIARNKWFGDKARRRLETLNSEREPVVFSFSYAARPLLELAKERGWRTVLGQIDCGQQHWKLVSELNARDGIITSQPPDRYWEDWHSELTIADKIIVNSKWALNALLSEGIPETKICLLPLAYSPPKSAANFRREYPNCFDRTRPMNVLFLGGVSRSKGIIEFLEAANTLHDEPVKFTIVGSNLMQVPEKYLKSGNINWAGAVTRDEVHNFYKTADIFVFPTHSDGFGITQLEAQAWKLPVIASRMCGEVVSNGINGIILDEVSPEAIASSLRTCLDNPCLLRAYSEKSVACGTYSLEALGNSLETL